MRSPEHRQVAPPRAGRRFEDELQLHYLAPGAFTILPPERRHPAEPPPGAPEPYRLTPGTKRQKKPSFAIIGDVNTSGGSSPSGRVSPFKGRGFNPIGSRHGSPSRSPPPPEDARLTPTNLSPSKIPLPQKKFGNNAKRRISNKLSQSLSDLDAKVAQEAKQGTRRQMHAKTTAFQKLSPIIGSSPEPSQSMSSPSRIPRSQSTPPSRKPSPSRYTSSMLSKPPMSNSSVVRSRSQSRSQSRNASRNASRTASREPSPTKAPTSPSRIPLSRYKNVQAKVNSNNKPKPKVLPKPEVSSEQSDSEPAKTKFKTPLSRKESVNRIRTDSRPNLLPKTGNYSKNIYPSTSDSSVGNVNTKNSGKGNNKYSSGTAPSSENKSLNKTNVIENDHHGENKNDTETTTANSYNSSEPNPKNKKSNKIEDLDTTETESENNDAVLTAKTTPIAGNEIIIQPDVSKKPDNLPSTATAVSSTTSTVVKPLKIEANLNFPDHVEKPQPRSPMIDGRVLSATSVSNAMNKMNDSVMDPQTLMRERGFSKLSPAANAVISVANEANKMNNSAAINTKNATTDLPTVPEPLPKNNERLAPKENHLTSNNHNHNNVHAKQIEHVLSSKALELEVQKHIQKMISPVPKGNKGKSVVTSDVQPIQIMVREKPSDIEVQSGNIRPVINVSNGINERPGLPPSQVTPPNEPEKQPPKNACTKLFANCKTRMCSCCIKNEKNELDNNTEGRIGCFGCVKKKHEPANIITENETHEKPVGCFSCSKREQAPARIIIENETDKKPKLLDRFNCCKSQKVGDMNCFPKGKRKENWAERRDSIMSTSTASRPKNDCKSILRKMFCLNRCCKRKGIEDLVRQPSIVSKKKSLTPTTALPPEDTSPKIDLSLVEHSSHMRAAIPILPICLAWFCLVMNCIAPGTGTVFSGMFCLCIGIPRFSQKDGPRPRIGSFIINIIIGIGQFFTVLFCLVGWGWSIWWGVIMLKIAKKHKKLKHFEAIEQASSMPPVHPNSRQPIQQKRT